MPDYRKMYLKMFHASVDVLKILTEVQKECEELYLSSDEPRLEVVSTRSQQQKKSVAEE